MKLKVMDIWLILKYTLKPLLPLVTIFAFTVAAISYLDMMYDMPPPPWLTPTLLSFVFIYVLLVLVFYTYQQFVKNIKLFRYNPHNGTMWNKDVRNVAFRTETINRILASMCEYCENYKNQIQEVLEQLAKIMVKSPHEEIGTIRDNLQRMSVEMGTSILEEVGYKAGTGFAKDVLLPDYARPRWRKEKLTPKEKVQIWCEYDSDVGWGRFRDNLSDDIEKGEILVEECFLNYSHGKDVCRSTCSWMVGYIRGILDEIRGETMKKKYNVAINDKYCDRTEYCHFIVDREPLPANAKE